MRIGEELVLLCRSQGRGDGEQSAHPGGDYLNMRKGDAKERHLEFRQGEGVTRIFNA